MTKPTEEQIQEMQKIDRWENIAKKIELNTSNGIAMLIMVILASIIVVVHGFWATSTDCATDFARAGSAVVALALFTIAPYQWSAAVMGAGARLGWSGRHVAVPKLSNPFLAIPLLAIFGTFIWGYGDLMAIWLGLAKAC